jgi:hypothetical protein
MILLARRQEAGRSRCGDALGRGDPNGRMHARERPHGVGRKAPESYAAWLRILGSRARSRQPPARITMTVRVRRRSRAEVLFDEEVRNYRATP